MEQEVNLYRVFEKPQPTNNFLSWKRFGYAQVAWLVILCIMYLYSIGQIYYYKAKKTKLEKQAIKLQIDFYALKRNYPQLFFSQDVGETVRSLQKELELQKKAFQALDNPYLFSQCFIAFSKNIVPNVWLTYIAINKSGNAINLKGKSLTAENLQKFIENLLNDSFFSKFVLSVNQITNSDKNNKDNYFNFELSMNRPL